MPRSPRLILDLQPWYSLVGSLCLAVILLPVIGCGGSSATPQPTVAVVADDPAGEFEWGMTRLKRALRLFRPSGAEGMVTKRNVEYELIPPQGENSNYTAWVTVVSETSYLHGKRVLKKNEQKAAQEESKIDDPLDDKSNDDYTKFVDIPGAGPQAPDVAAAKIETRSLDSNSVFELAYVEGHWKLTQTPEKKHEQLWFEYAFD